MKHFKLLSINVLYSLFFSLFIVHADAQAFDVTRAGTSNKLCCKKNKNNCALPSVDVNVPLHVEYDQFGRPIVIGTPNQGPEHGVGSYWYQIGYMTAEPDVKVNFAPLVFAYLSAAGRTAEYIVGADLFFDVHARRITYTNAQIEGQIESQQGTDFPVAMLDFLDGRHQAYIDYIIKVQNGLEPLPADFIEGIGILNWFWQDVTADINVAYGLFNRAVFVKALQGSNDIFGSSVAPFDQIFNAYLPNVDSTSVDPSGGIDAFNLINDCNGDTSYNFRFTVKEGDRSGLYCENNFLKNSASKKVDTKARKHHTESSLSEEQRQNFAKQVVAKFANDRRKLLDRRIMSDWLVVGSSLTKDGSAMMFGNSQTAYGFDGDIDNFTLGAVWRATSFFTPEASSYSPALITTYVRSKSGCEIFLSPEVTSVAARDAAFEDAANLILIYDEETGTENVPGGKEQSTIYVREPDGSITFFFTKIYQGNDQRHGLEFDFRLFDDENPEFVTIIRQPFDWLTDIGAYLKGFANYFGMLPFNRIKEFAVNWNSNPFVFMYGGFDNKNNIYSISGGFYNTITTPDFNRLYPQDATETKFFESLVFPRTLPVPTNAEYRADGSRYFQNPSCGFIAAWNGIWSNDDQTNFGSSFEYDRVGSIFYDINQKLDEQGKLVFQDIQDLWSQLNLQRDGRRIVQAEFQNYASDMFPNTMRETCLTALQAKGLDIGLSPHEIERGIKLLSEPYDGRSIPNVDQADRMEGLNWDGRWVLSQLWISMLGRNMFEQGIPDPILREVTGLNYAFLLFITEPTGDWSQETPDQSRVLPVAISANAYFCYSLILRVLQIGPDLGNPVYYQWYDNILASTGLDLNNADDRQIFIAQAFKDGLEIMVTGSNAGTGLADPVTGRANLDLIQDNGVPLHPGWGQNQRTVQLPVPPYVTLFLENNFVVKNGTPTLNREGQVFYAQRDACGRLTHFQTASQIGFSSLLTVREVNGESLVIVEPHATDQAYFFEGNYDTNEIPLSIKKKFGCA
ncbi:MAG: hypothetical protein AB7F19_02155 [Candidatus Babeliales bacterium]